MDRYFSSKDRLRFRISRELHLGVCHVSQMQLPTWQGENALRERGKKKVGRTAINKDFSAFHWLSPCQERREAPLLPVGLCSYHRKELPLLVSQLYLIEISVYYFFTLSPFDQDFSLKALLIKSQVL